MCEHIKNIFKLQRLYSEDKDVEWWTIDGCLFSNPKSAEIVDELLSSSNTNCESQTYDWAMLCLDGIPRGPNKLFVSNIGWQW